MPTASLETELEIIAFVEEVIKVYPELPNYVLNIPSEFGELGTDALVSLRRILTNDLDQLDQLLSQSWVRDGLTDEEVALIVVLPSIVSQENIFNELLESGHVVSDTLSLPLAGEVNLFAVSRTPLQQDVLGILRTGVEVMEGFMHRPWNKPNVIALVEPEWYIPIGGSFYERTFIVSTSLNPGVFYHELGHYFFNRMTVWFIEGVAEFLRSYTLNKSHQLPIQMGSIKRCAMLGAPNIQKWLDTRDSTTSAPFRLCHYALGKFFLLGMYALLGHDAGHGLLTAIV